MNGRKGSSQSWLLDFFQKAKKVYADTARDIVGDLWDACSEDGLGLPKQVTVAEYYKIGSAAYQNRYDHPKAFDEKMQEVKSAPTYIRIFHKKIPEFNHPSQVRTIMFANKDAERGKDTSGIFTRLFGDRNIFEEETKSDNWEKLSGEFHRHFFAEPELKKIVPDMHDIAKKYLNEIKEQGGISHLSDFSARFAMEVTGSTRLGLIHFPNDFMESFTATIDEAIKKIGNPKISMPQPLSSFIEFYDKYVLGHKTLDEIMAPGYARLAELIKSNQDTILETPNWIRDVSLKRAWDPQNNKTAQEWLNALENRDDAFIQLLYSMPVLKDAGLSLVVGHETSAQSLISVITFLLDEKHKPILERVRQEIQEYLNDNEKAIDDLTKDDLNHFTFLKAVFHESLRLRPPLAKLKGMVNRDVIVDDVILHKGDYFFLSTSHIQQNETVYKNPLVFDPTRFLKKDEEGHLLKDAKEKFIFKEPDPAAFFPFGFNERKCPGRNFTRLEVMFLVALLVMKYRFVMDNPFCYRTEQGFNLRSAVNVSIPLEETLTTAPRFR